MFSATILSLFPAMFPGPLGQSLAGDALARGLWSLDARDIREHGLGRHRAVDDTPAGGGPGMVMRADVLAASLDAAVGPDDARPRLIMSPRGAPFRQAQAREWAAGPGLVLVCPRFEGVDERAIEARGLVEVSIGDPFRTVPTHAAIPGPPVPSVQLKRASTRWANLYRAPALGVVIDTDGGFGVWGGVAVTV